VVNESLGNDLFYQITHNPIILLLIIAPIVAIFLYWKFGRGGSKKDVFTPDKLSDILRDRIRNNLKLITDNRCYGTLRRGYVSLGYINRHGLIEIDTGTKTDKMVLHIFEITEGLSIINKIMAKFGMGLTYVIVPGSIVWTSTLEGAKLRDYYTIPENLELTSFGTVYIFGDKTYEWLRGQAWLKEREDELTELVNFAKRIVYLEASHSKGTETLEMLDNIKRAGYKQYITNMTTPNKKSS